MAKTSAAAPPAKAAQGTPQSLQEVVQQITKLKTDAEILASIADIYQRFLNQKDALKVVKALDTLLEAKLFESHVWRVRALALTTGNTHQHAWMFTLALLISHRLRHAECNSAGITSAWAFVQEDTASWRLFLGMFVDGFKGSNNTTNTVREKAVLVQFLSYCLASLDVDAVASEVLKLVSLPMWATALSPSQRALELAQQPKLARLWKKLMPETSSEAEGDGDEDNAEPAQKKRRKTAVKQKTPSTKSSSGVLSITHREKAFIVDLLADFEEILAIPPAQLKRMNENDADEKLRYVALVLALLADLLSQLPTRRFLEVVVRRKHVATRLRQSSLIQWLLECRSSLETAALTKQMERLETLLHFPIDAHSGKSLLTLQERQEATTRKIQTLQLAAFATQYRETPIETLAIVPVSTIVDRTRFKDALAMIIDQDHREPLETLGVELGVFADDNEAQVMAVETLVECFVDEYASLPTHASARRRVVLPTEMEIWSDAVAETTASQSPVYSASASALFPVLALPKLGLQYLNLADFLDRNAELCGIEAAHAIRQDLETTIRPLNAVRSLARNGETVFRGFAQFAAPLLTAFSIVKVDAPAIGETVPASVIGQFDIELDTRHDITAFDRFQTGEVVYLVTIRPTRDEAAEAMGFVGTDAEQDGSGHFAEDYGVLYVRCAELVEMQDESGHAVKPHESGNGNSQDKVAVRGKGRKRSLQVTLDGAQYKKDQESGLLGAYEYVNLLVRRDPRTNNFKAVLDSIAAAQHALSCSALLPAWLNDLFLGYGDPQAAGFEAIAKRKLQAQVSIPVAPGVFVDAAHAVESSFDGVRLVNADDQSKPLEAKDAKGPFTFDCDVASKTFVVKAHPRKATEDVAASPSSSDWLRLTKEQAQFVVRGTAEGLTIATGATGKSLALAHLLQNLVQTSKPDEKILVIARSTVQLDKLLGKLTALPFVDQATVVRLGGGSGNACDDFSCQGRVDLLLQRRIDLLTEVDAMAKWMERVDGAKYAGLSSSASYSCENALFFYRFYIKALLDEATQATAVADTVLKSYYTERMGAEATAIGELQAFTARMDGVFGELHRLQAFELLQMPAQRRDVYLMQHARVVAMTSRHAALQFKKLRALQLHWTSVVLEDAHEISEVDAFIPLALASSSSSSSSSSPSKAQRVVMVGNETVAMPAGPKAVVVETSPLKSYARFDASLFSRLLRLGVPRITLQPVPPAATSGSATSTATVTTKDASVVAAQPETTKKAAKTTKATPSKKTNKK